jgi:hypothetical protein
MQDMESLKAYLEELVAPAGHHQSATAGAAAVARHGLRHWSMQRKLRRAVRVFGLDRLVERLQPYITGGEWPQHQLQLQDQLALHVGPRRSL